MPGYGSLGPQAASQVARVRAGLADGSIPRTPEAISAALGGLAGVSGDELPYLVQELSGSSGGGGDLFPTPFELPGSAEALTGLRGLQTTGAGGLDRLLQGDFLGGRTDEIEQAMFENASEDINRQADELGRTRAEGLFGRGVGESSMTREALSDIDRERFNATARARRDAITGAGGEARADLGARLAALGQAFNSGTTGLQAESTVPMTNTGREQQARTIGAQMKQSGEQFSQELASRENLQNKAFATAEKIAGDNRSAAAISSGIGGLSQFFAPTANAALKNFFKLA